MVESDTDREKEIKVPAVVVLLKEDFDLALSLIEEAGVTLDNLRLYQAGGKIDVTIFNSDIPHSKIAIKAMVRERIFDQLGHKLEWPFTDNEGKSHHFPFEMKIIEKNDENKVVFVGKRTENPDWEIIKNLLEKSSKWGLNWNFVTFWKLGKMENLQKKKTPKGALLMLETQEILFSDELEKLNNGESVITFFSSGLGRGFISSDLTAYCVEKGTLYRVSATYTD